MRSLEEYRDIVGEEVIGVGYHYGGIDLVRIGIPAKGDLSVGDIRRIAAINLIQVDPLQVGIPLIEVTIHQGRTSMDM